MRKKNTPFQIIFIYISSRLSVSVRETTEKGRKNSSNHGAANLRGISSKRYYTAYMLKISSAEIFVKSSQNNATSNLIQLSIQLFKGIQETLAKMVYCRWKSCKTKKKKKIC